MSMFVRYARRLRAVNGQFMFPLALLGACSGAKDTASAVPTGEHHEAVAVTRAALGGDCDSSSTIIPVDTCQELQDMELDLCGRYELTADLDCSAFDAGDSGGFRPVGMCWPWEPFRGSFDGNGHVVTGLTIERPETNYVGLFGCIADTEVRDIGLDDAQIHGAAVVGSIAGVAFWLIRLSGGRAA